MVAPLGLSHFFLFPASRREGRKASSGQTEEQHACFSWHARDRRIPILAYTLGTRAMQACHGWPRMLAVSKYQPAPTLPKCPEHPVRSRGCEESQLQRERRGVERDPRGKREGQSNFLGDSPFLSPSQNPTPTAFSPFFLTCTLSASMYLSPQE